MQGQHKYLAFCLVLIAIGICVLVYMKPSSAPTPSTQSQMIVGTNDGSPNAQIIQPNTASFQVSHSQQDTEINCQISIDQSKKLIINEHLKNCFEYFITQYGEKELIQIQQDFEIYIKDSYLNPAQSQILDLWSRYLHYRQALADLPTPSAKPETVAYHQQAYDALKSLRQKHFSNVEIEGLFGMENIYHDYTLKRLAILENPNLKETEKAQLLKSLFDELPSDWKENLEQIATLDNLRQLTQELKARQASKDEIQQMRINLVGIEAAQRLEQLDISRQTWRNQVTQYLAQRHDILQSTMSDQAKQQAIENLRTRHFSQEHEKLRLKTFETIYDQGGKLPFQD